MKTSVLVTAVSGTGKSTVCRSLHIMGYSSIDIESIDGLYELINEKTSEIIPGNLDQIAEGVGWNCNKTKLKELLEAQTSELTFYCGGMSNTEDIWESFDDVIVLTVSDETTIKRLSNRQSGEFGSSEMNRDWVLSWKHELEERWIDMGGIQDNRRIEPRSGRRSHRKICTD